MSDLAAALEKLRREHLYRTRSVRSTSQQTEPVINGQKVLSFCSNDYLGLASHPKVTESYVKAAKKYGVGSGASHLVTGHHQSHHDLEEELADFIGCERTLLFSSGYMANLGVVGALANRNTTVFEDRLNHASLVDASIIARARLKRYQHLDVDELRQKLSAEEKSSTLVLTDGVFSMDGTVAQVADLQTLAKDYGARLIIDDAHGIGVLGENGKGCTEGQLAADTILVGTLGKALGTFGAFVAARQDTIEWCIQRARTYIYTTALPPSLAEATRTSLQLIREEPWRRTKLRTLIKRFRQHAKQASLPVADSMTPIQPVITGSSSTALTVGAKLLEKGIMVAPIRPPTVAQARLRISFSATHTEDQVDRLVEALVEVSRSSPGLGS